MSFVFPRNDINSKFACVFDLCIVLSYDPSLYVTGTTTGVCFLNVFHYINLLDGITTKKFLRLILIFGIDA